jgi:hypothetical protein
MGEKSDRQPTWGDRAFGLIQAQVSQFLGNPASAKSMQDAARSMLGEPMVTKIGAILRGPLSYRDGMLIQAAFSLARGDQDPAFDMCRRQVGARDVAKKVGALFADNHIPSVKDAYQNIAKNSDILTRGNVPDFDGLLNWGNSAPKSYIEGVFNYVVACATLSARPVVQMPELDTGKLTFVRLAGLLNEVLDTPSGGAHEQFLVAAFLHALLHEYGFAVQGGLHVDTKNINASDSSARTAADVQIRRANRTDEALEVTANKWAEKLMDAVVALKNHDLQKIHVVAPVESGSIRENEDIFLIEQAGFDVSVLDLRGFLFTVMAFMRKPARALALGRFYDLLERKQPKIELVNNFVGILEKHRLVIQMTASS